MARALDRLRRAPALGAPVLLWGFFALVVLFLELQRLAMLVRHRGYFAAATPVSTLAAAFVHGLRLDLVVAAYLLFAPLALALGLGLVQASPRLSARLVRAAMLVEIAPAAVLAWGELEFFGYFRDRYNALALEYLDTPGVVWQTIWERYHPIATGCAAAATVAVFAWLLGRIPAPDARPSRRAAALGALLSIAAAVLFVRGWGLVPVRWGSAYFSADTAANQLALDGLFNLATELEYGQAPPASHAFYPEGIARKRAKAYLRNPNEEYVDGFVKSSRPAGASVATVRRPKIVIVLLESFAAQAVGALGGPLASTPEFDRLAEGGVLFTRHFSQGVRTGRALFSVVAGIPAPPDGNILKGSAGRRHYETLGAVMHAQGYTTRFVYGGDLDFENMDGFLRHNDFDELVGVGDFPNGRLWQWRLKWGVPDDLVFTRAHELLLHDAGPSLTVILTLTNHPPFRLPPDAARPYSGPLADERNAIRYSDWALGRFMEKARSAPYFDDTIFVIAGDHGQLYDGVPASDLSFFHVPCLVYGPRALGVAPHRVDAITGHTDIAPTIVGLLGAPARHSFWGRDLFHQLGEEPRVLISNLRGQLLVESGRVVRDGPEPEPRLYAFDDPDRLSDLYAVPTEDDSLLVKERTLTQALVDATRLRAPGSR